MPVGPLADGPRSVGVASPRPRSAWHPTCTPTRALHRAPSAATRSTPTSSWRNPHSSRVRCPAPGTWARRWAAQLPDGVTTTSNDLNVRVNVSSAAPLAVPKPAFAVGCPQQTAPAGTATRNPSASSSRERRDRYPRVELVDVAGRKEGDGHGRAGLTGETAEPQPAPYARLAEAAGGYKLGPPARMRRAISAGSPLPDVNGRSVTP